jgi:hypothetical protein
MGGTLCERPKYERSTNIDLLVVVPIVRLPVRVS